MTAEAGAYLGHPFHLRDAKKALVWGRMHEEGGMSEAQVALAALEDCGEVSMGAMGTEIEEEEH